MSNTYYKKGQWSAICDRCGFEYKSKDLRKTWDGLMVCKKDWEPRHPQEFVRGVKDQQAVPWSRPEAEDGKQEIAYATTLTLDGTSYSSSYTDVLGTTFVSKTFTISPLTGNVTFNAPTNPITNEVITIEMAQDEVGNRVVTWNAIFTGITLPSSGRAFETTSILFKYNGSNWVQYSTQPIWI